MDIERKADQYVGARRRMEKLHPGAKVSAHENAGYFIENAAGKNIMDPRYPELAYADTVMDAYINLDIVNHWKKIEDRNSWKFRNDAKNVCVVGDASVTTSERMQDYVTHIEDWSTSDGQPED
jgi:hypothetical protein